MKRYLSATCIVIALLFLSACAPAAAPKAMASASLPPYDGPIETLAIVLSPGSYFYGMDDLIYDEAVTAIYQSDYVRSRFDLVERQDTDTLLEEQGLIKDGYVDNSAGPQIGKLLGAKYVLIVEVTNATATRVSGGGILGLGGSGFNTDVRISMRLIDSETALIVGRSTGRVSQLVADGITILGMNANMNDEQSAIISVFPAALQDAIDVLLLQIA
jgi:curli biogenesis system outer membrane secretion channel CsgG